MTAEADRARREKNKAWNKNYHTRNPELYEEFEVKRNLAFSNLRQAQEDFEKRIVCNIKEDTESFWKFVRSETRSRSTLGELNMDNGQMANTLNSYYHKVFNSEDTRNETRHPDRHRSSAEEIKSHESLQCRWS